MDKKVAILKLIEKYRRLLYLLHGRSTRGILPAGVLCNVKDPTEVITHSDVVHPCVRFVKEGFEGHQWWMVYTPLYGGDDSLENPRLCYADSVKDGAPTEWEYYCTIRNCPQTGYNSDPTLFFKEGKLYIFWREVDTPEAKNFSASYITIGCYVEHKNVVYLCNPQLVEPLEREAIHDDREICPTLISRGDTKRFYTMHLTLAPNFIFSIPSHISSFIYRHNVFFLLKALGLYSNIKSHGVAMWDCNSIEGKYHYVHTKPFANQSCLYQPWHMDIVQNESITDLYAVVQTSLFFADICLTYSRDGEQFRFFKKPLLTSRSIGMSGIYKPTALVVDNRFYLYYTARDNDDFKLNRLYVTSMEWPALLQMLK